MNRLNTNIKFPTTINYNFIKLNYSHTYPSTIDPDTGKRVASVERKLESVEIDFAIYRRALEMFSYCNPTDYETYKSWIVYWKQVYAKLTIDIRAAKKHWKQCVRTERSFQMSDYALSHLKDIANAFLRIRQQMKMFNRYYMQARKEDHNV